VWCINPPFTDAESYSIDSGGLLELSVQRAKECFDNCVIAFEEHPLTDARCSYEFCLSQCGEMHGYRRLGHTQERSDLARANAIVKGEWLPWKMHTWFPQECEDLAPDWVGERLIDCVDVECHWKVVRIVRPAEGSCIPICIGACCAYVLIEADRAAL